MSKNITNTISLIENLTLNFEPSIETGYEPVERIIDSQRLRKLVKDIDIWSIDKFLRYCNHLTGKMIFYEDATNCRCRGDGTANINSIYQDLNPERHKIPFDYLIDIVSFDLVGAIVVKDDDYKYMFNNEKRRVTLRELIDLTNMANQGLVLAIYEKDINDFNVLLTLNEEKEVMYHYYNIKIRVL